MGNQVSLRGKEISEFEKSLIDKADDFTEKFKSLDDEIKRLTSNDYTGDAAKIFLSTYNNKVRPDLENIERIASKYSEYMTDKREGFEKLSSRLNDEMGR